MFPEIITFVIQYMYNNKCLLFPSSIQIIVSWYYIVTFKTTDTISLYVVKESRHYL